ncbi:hypothetical protein ACA910_005090 [Epithemia clementina (nom. ined.)]
MQFVVEALESLTATQTPPEKLLHPCKHGSKAQYMFGDASGAGFGLSSWSPGDMDIKVDYGSWGAKESEATSSNFRELANIVIKIEQMDTRRLLNDSMEVFVFTNNFHAESAF